VKYHVLILFLFLLLGGCASSQNEELVCNFVDGALNKNNKSDSGFFNSVFSGVVNILTSDANSNCVNRDKSICINGDGSIKEKCTNQKSG